MYWALVSRENIEMIMKDVTLLKMLLFKIRRLLKVISHDLDLKKRIPNITPLRKKLTIQKLSLYLDMTEIRFLHFLFLFSMFSIKQMFNKILDRIIMTSRIFFFSSVQLLSHVRLFATPWITACQASLSITNSQSSLRLMSIKSVMPSSHLILCCPLLLLPSIPPSIRVFSNESTFRMRWPKYWSFSFSIIPSKEIPGLISFRMYFPYNPWNPLNIKGL